MRLRDLVALVLLSSPAAHAQAPSVANMGVHHDLSPEQLLVQDKNGGWVPIGNFPPGGPFVPATAPLFDDHASLLAGADGVVKTLQQRGYYASGDGGTATYDWNATSYCGGTAAAPIAADGVACILPSLQDPSVAGRYRIRPNVNFDARAVGMLPGGQDNSPYVPALLLANGPATGSPTTVSGYGATFSPAQGLASTEYYFSQAISWSRTGHLYCGGAASGANVALVFEAGVDGVDVENELTSTDGGTGFTSDIDGCAIISIGMGNGYISNGQTNLTGPTIGTPPTLWAYGKIKQYTQNLSGPVTAGSTLSVGIAACPAPAPRVGAPVIDNSLTPAATLGTFASCVGTTLTFQNPASISSAGNGDNVTFSQWEAGDGIVASPIAWGNNPTSPPSGSLLSVPYGDRVASVNGDGSLTLTAAAVYPQGLQPAWYSIPMQQKIVRLPVELAYHTTTLGPTVGAATAPWTTTGANLITVDAATCARAAPGEYVMDTSYSPAVQLGYVISCSGTTLALNAAPTTASKGASDALQFTSNTVVMASGPQVLVQPGDHLWSDSYAFGATVGMVFNRVGNTLAQTWSAQRGTFVASISPDATTGGGDMAVASISAGNLCVGGNVTVPSGQPNALAGATAITSLPGGETSGCSSAIGTYGVSSSQTVGSETLNAAGVNVALSSPCPTGFLAQFPANVLDVTQNTNLFTGGGCTGSTLTLAGQYTAGNSGDQVQLPVSTHSLPLATAAGKQVLKIGSFELLPASTFVASQNGSGVMWRLPQGISRRTQSKTHKDLFRDWVFALNMACSGGYTPPCNATTSYDQEDMFIFNLFGRIVTGQNTGASTDQGSEYADNYGADIVEAGTVGSSYINANSNSAESGTSKFGVMGYCGSQNYSDFFGGYIVFGGAPLCLPGSPDGPLEAPVWLPPLDGAAKYNSFNFVGVGGGWDTPTTGASGSYGTKTFYGQPEFYTAATAAVAPGGTVVDVTATPFALSFLYAGLIVSDFTRPAALPLGTTIAAFDFVNGALTLSNPVLDTGGGVGIANGDTLKINSVGDTYGTAMCISLGGGYTTKAGIYFSRNCGTDAWFFRWNSADNLWGFDTYSGFATVFGLVNGDYAGYRGFVGPIAPTGLELSNAVTPSSTARIYDAGPSAPSGSTYRTQGDVRFNTAATPGGAEGWVMTPTWSSTLSEPILVSQTGTFTASIAPVTSNFTGSVTGGVMTVDGTPPTNPIKPGALVTGAGFSAYVMNQLSGTTGGLGTYTMATTTNFAEGALSTSYGLMTVSALSGQICVRGTLAGSGLAPSTLVTATDSGAAHGCSTGTTNPYVVNVSQTLGPVSLTSTGQNAVAVAACPAKAPPAGAITDDMTVAGGKAPAYLGGYLNCYANVLTLQALPLAAAATSDSVMALEQRPFGLIANDTGGNLWSVNANISGGTKPAFSGPCAVNTIVGGATAGSFKLTANCSADLTMTFAAGIVAPTGWTCAIVDMTTPADRVVEDAYTTVSATMNFVNQTSAGDQFVFACTGF